PRRAHAGPRAERIGGDVARRAGFEELLLGARAHGTVRLANDRRPVDLHARLGVGARLPDAGAAVPEVATGVIDGVAARVARGVEVGARGVDERGEALGAAAAEHVVVHERLIVRARAKSVALGAH